MVEINIARSCVTTCDFGAKNKQTNETLSLNVRYFWRQTQKILHHNFPKYLRHKDI